MSDAPVTANSDNAARFISITVIFVIAVMVIVALISAALRDDPPQASVATTVYDVDTERLMRRLDDIESKLNQPSAPLPATRIELVSTPRTSSPIPIPATAAPPVRRSNCGSGPVSRDHTQAAYYCAECVYQQIAQYPDAPGVVSAFDACVAQQMRMN